MLRLDNFKHKTEELEYFKYVFPHPVHNMQLYFLHSYQKIDKSSSWQLNTVCVIRVDTEAIGNILIQLYIKRKGKHDLQCNLNTTKTYRLFLA